ncbi:MAG: rod shape-determining protein MreC [Patescibacteria group bacterium]
MKKIINYAVLFVIVVLVLFLFLNTADKKPLQSSVQWAVSPVANFFSGAGYWFKDKTNFFTSIGELKDQNGELYKENIRLKSQIAELKNIENENEELRSQLDLAPREEYDLEAALVNGKSLVEGSEMLYLNKGEKNGIISGMPVVVGEGVLVGKVEKVFPGSCEVRLILDSDIKVNAEILESETKGMVHGEYGSSVVMDKIPQSIEIKKDETVVTSGLGGALPGGLLIGYVKDVSTTADQLFQKASLNLPAEIEEARMVWIIKK